MPAPRVLRLLVVLLVAVPLVGPQGFVVGGPDAAWADVDVHGDDTRDLYVGTGAVVLPEGLSARRAAATCADCSWRVSGPCLGSDPGSPLGNAFDGGCTSVTRGCGGGGRLVRGWLRRPPEGWQELGLACIGPGGPVRVADLSRSILDRFEAGMPALRPALQPAVGVVTQVPVVFRSGQPEGDQVIDETVLGLDVRIRAHPEWTWSFGDGAVLRTDRAGGTAPDRDVAHVYRSAAPYTARVAVEWSATVTIPGIGTVPVAGTLHQDAMVPVAVGEGRALLRPAGRP